MKLTQLGRGTDIYKGLQLYAQIDQVVLQDDTYPVLYISSCKPLPFNSYIDSMIRELDNYVNQIKENNEMSSSILSSPIYVNVKTNDGQVIDKVSKSIKSLKDICCVMLSSKHDVYTTDYDIVHSDRASINMYIKINSPSLTGNDLELVKLFDVIKIEHVNDSIKLTVNVDL